MFHPSQVYFAKSSFSDGSIVRTAPSFQLISHPDQLQSYPVLRLVTIPDVLPFVFLFGPRSCFIIRFIIRSFSLRLQVYYDGNRIGRPLVKWPCDGSSSGNEFQLRQPVRSEDRNPHSGNVLPGSIDVRRSHADVDQDSSDQQSGSGRL